MTAYAVKEIFLTLQGEGAHTGRAAVFCRFSGCNLWSGRERDRARSRCTFCDTDFVEARWLGDLSSRLCVLTGGEPLLQVDPDLLRSLHERSFEVAVETNGTLPAPAGIDWICVSPKAGTDLQITSGDELKLVYPQPGAEPARYETSGFRRLSLQPLDGPARDENLAAAVDYCLQHPQWRLSLQTHKTIGIR
jgi:organic radical activating enzyme